ncbi:MAG: mechanosensitive ion channel family protein, partial [Syntrophorhabdales bacterium]
MTTRVLCAVLLLSLLVSAGFAAEKPVASPQAGQTQPKVVQESAEDDPLGRSTPQGAVLGFMRASQRQDYELAVEYLNTKQPAKRAEQLALELQFVMDRGLTDDLNRLSRSPEGDLADGLPPNRERVGIIGSGQEAIDIQLERVQRPNEPPLWLFSGDTLARIPRAYEGLDAPVLDRYLPSVLSRTRILHVSLWRWIAFFVVLPLLFVLARLAAWAVVPLFRPLIRRLAHEDDEAPAERIKNPLTVFLLGLALYAYAPLSHSALSRLFWNRMAATVTVIGVSWLCLRFIDILVERAARAYHMTEASGRIAIARLAGQLCKGIAVVVAAAVILYYAGINLTAVLTGLGVGGVAIAFAAQKTLENLFGGVMIASDQPIRVGDYCRAGEYSGTVENIGLRSTRIRTLDRTVVSVPNGQLSVMSLENFALRDKIRFHHTLSLQCEASADQLRHVLDGIREVLDSRPEVERGSSQVRLVALRNSAFDVEVFAYILATPWDAFLALQEEMLLQMIDVV